MGAIRPARPVNLICGFFSNDTDLLARAIHLLSDYAGPTDLISPQWPFESTEYYEAEMGEGLIRQFASFERLINPEDLANIKILTNQLEQRICYECGVPEGQRRVNIDPGYLALAKVVLATTKDFSHRIYLRDGIYAESTLHYEAGGWLAWPWTYPDFAAPTYHDFFHQVRELYKAKLNQRGKSEAGGGLL